MSTDSVVEWLLAGPPWVRYCTRTDLMGQPETDSGVMADRRAMLDHPQVLALISDLSAWPGPAIKRHNDAGHLLHKLVFVSNIGLRASDPGMSQVVTSILKTQSIEGPFRITANISPQYGGSGRDQLAWMLCDAPSVLYSVTKLGMDAKGAVKTAAQHLASLSSEYGWPCTVSSELGKFRGPGRKSDPCPYATLTALKALTQLPEWRESEACRAGAEALLRLWEQRKERRPYLFAMGTDFKKLKAPTVWYDILHVLDVLTQFPHLRTDKRLIEMAEMVRAKADAQGRFRAESVWKAWSDWEFGQKKEHSYFLTLHVHRILRRMAWY